LCEHIGSDDSEAGGAQKALTCSREGIATRVTKSSTGADTGRGKAEDHKQGGKLAGKQLKSREKRRWIYTRYWDLYYSLEATIKQRCARAATRAWQRITRIGNPCFLMRNRQHAHN
jgi:hypothetical protein